MKNLIKFFITATILFTAACTSKDLDSSIAGGNAVEVFFTTNLADSDTRTYNSGTHVDKLYYFVCDSDNRILSDLCGTCDEKVDEKFSFTLSLLRGMEYHIYFWAQKDGVYSVENGVVSIDYSENNIEANNGDLDAFYGSVVIPSDIQSATQNIQLHRPFAQLNALTNDGNVLLNNDVASFENVTSTATIKGVYSQFNLISGTVAGNPIEITFAPAMIPSGKGEQALNANYTYISMNYLFVPTTQKCVADVVFTVTAQRKTANTDDIVIETPLYTSVPLKSNYKTNIIGKLLTNSTEFNIELDCNWGGNDEYVLGGGEVTLTEDIVANKIVVKEDTILKLNGKNIVGGQPDSPQMSGIDIAAITIENGATLTIEGEGTITGSEYGVYVKDGKVIIKGGNTSAGTSAVQVYNGTAEIEGGEFSATKSNTYVINCIDACWKNGTAKVIITGGTFHNFDPANNAAEGPNTNFCPRGYTTTTTDNGLTYTIIPPITISDGLSYTDFLSSLKDGNYTGSVAVMLTDDVTPIKTFDVPANADVYLNLNGQTITVDPETLKPNSNGYHYAFIIRDGGTLTIDGNGTIEATTPAPIMFYPAGDLVIENGTFIRNIPEGYSGAANSMFVGTSPTGGWESAGVTIKGGYFDSGYYNANAKDIEEILAGTKTLEETADDISKRGAAGDKNKVRVALKNNCMAMFNRSSNYFKIYGGTFVGANPAWGDEGCMLPTNPIYLRPWSYYQGAVIDGQEFNADGIVLPEGYVITKGTHEDGRPTYTVTYSE